jgi:hypothetical protein
VIPTSRWTILRLAMVWSLLLGACAGRPTPQDPPASPAMPTLTDPGEGFAPPEGDGVDVFVRDTPVDEGHESILATRDPSRSPDIVVDAPPFERPPTTSEAFDAFGLEELVPGQENRVYVRVFNRGIRAASEVTVTLLSAPAGFTLPTLAGGRELGRVSIGDVPSTGTGTEQGAIVQFSLEPIEVLERPHQCLVALVHADADPLGAVDDVPLDILAARSNGVAARNVAAVSEPVRAALLLRNPLSEPAIATLTSTGADGWTVSVADVGLGEPVRLAPGEQRSVEVEVASTKETAAMLTIAAEVEANGELLAGAMSFETASAEG